MMRTTLTSEEETTQLISSSSSISSQRRPSPATIDWLTDWAHQTNSPVRSLAMANYLGGNAMEGHYRASGWVWDHPSRRRRRRSKPSIRNHSPRLLQDTLRKHSVWTTGCVVVCERRHSMRRRNKGREKMVKENEGRGHCCLLVFRSKKCPLIFS